MASTPQNRCYDVKKEENNPFDSWCGSVETCRKADRYIIGGSEGIREESVCLES